MFKFLRLSNKVINPLHIASINTYEDCYKIFMANVHVDSFLIFGSGLIHSDKNYFKVHKKNKTDYDTITEWMRKNSDN
jgi:hypothetical protein